ncbi:uncharacterized protein LOC132696439 [Cylas formicarius]|uniref:uncharacterized protein LOC132696439 n=1 Tax=Cylas formicarius TaxID=197179 RepID=UPI002958BB0B|nr:uncharacterized protein LOC132696439 [Cylas formicarius]
MFQKFCGCFKYRFAAILMAYLCLVIGVIGTIYYMVKLYLKSEKSDEEFLTVCIFHLIASAILTSAIVWEVRVLILAYEFLHLSIQISLLTFATIYVRSHILYWGFICWTGLFVYWEYCIHMYLRQLEMKLKSTIYYVDNDVYSVCNRIYTNKISV